MISLHSEKSKLKKIFNQLFEVTELKVTEDLEGRDAFDYIPSKVYGAASYPPKKYLTKDYIEYCESNQGLTNLDIFIMLCVQVGGAIQYLPMKDELDRAERYREDYYDMYIETRKEFNKFKETERLPEGDVEDELRKVRAELAELKKRNAQLEKLQDKVRDLSKHLVV